MAKDWGQHAISKAKVSWDGHVHASERPALVFCMNCVHEMGFTTWGSCCLGTCWWSLSLADRNWGKDWRGLHDQVWQSQTVCDDVTPVAGQSDNLVAVICWLQLQDVYFVANMMIWEMGRWWVLKKWSCAICDCLAWSTNCCGPHTWLCEHEPNGVDTQLSKECSNRH